VHSDERAVKRADELGEAQQRDVMSSLPKAPGGEDAKVTGGMARENGKIIGIEIDSYDP
jgi:hypothetical protein